MQITDRVFQLEASARSHVFLYRSASDGIFLIDTGLPGLSGQILAELRNLGVPAGKLRAILLTHHDVDHIGNAERLRAQTGAEVWAPAGDLPYITGEKERPGVKRLIGALFRAHAPRVTGVSGDGWPFDAVRFLEAPGHTPGHTIYQAENVVFTGDLFRSTGGRLRLMADRMTWDKELAKRSLSLLTTLDFDWLCPAHGGPVQNTPALKAFLSSESE